jgi:hypothetical protein
MRFLFPVVISMLCAAHLGATSVVYDTTPAVLPVNMPSIPYQAGGVAEFGNKIGFASSGVSLDTVTVLLSNWAHESTYQAIGTSSGYSLDLVLTIYTVGLGDAVGAPLATLTNHQLIPWRQEPDAACAAVNSDYYLGSDSICHGGALVPVTFDFTATRPLLPEQVIFGLAFNTQSYGYSPLGAAGPYNSLNFAASTVVPTVGFDLNTDDAYVAYGAAAAAVFGQDTGWGKPYYTAAATFSGDPLPEPATFLLIPAGLALAFLKRRLKH